MTKRAYKFGSILAGASIAALGVAAPAVAQEAGESAETRSADNTRRLNTIEVTATRREGATIQDVPIAVTALDPEQLERAGVADIKTLDSVAPSFNMNTSDTESGGITLRLRGVGTTGNNIGLESSVGVFLDGVYLSRPGIALADLLDLQQIEVLRGPQGTLFGRNTSAGALNIQTKKPDLEEVEGFGNLTFGNYGLFNSQAGLNIPIVEGKFGVRVSGAFRDRDGFLTGIDGDDLNNLDRETYRGQAYADLGEAGTVRVILDYAKGEDECCDAVWFTDASTRAVFPATGLDPVGGAPNVGDNGADGLGAYDSNSANFFNPFEQWGASVTYENDLGFGDFTYIGSYRDYEALSFRNTDYVGLDIFTVGQSPEARATGNFDPLDGARIRTMTHEARIQGLALADRLDWLVGAYYSDETIESRGSLTLLDEYQAGVSAGLLGSPANLLNAFSAGVPATGDFAINAFNQEGESISVFTHNVYNFTDQFNMTLGLRYVDETKDGQFDQIGGQHNACLSTFGNLANIPAELSGAAVALNCFIFTAPAYDPANPGPLFGAIAQSPAAGLLGLLPQEYDDTFEDDELVYTVKAGYEFNENVNVYAGFTHGFKSGGFNLDASAGAGGADPRFDSEKIDAIEVGLKSTLLNGMATANIAVFHQEMEDFQVLEFTGVQFQTFNVDKAESTGVEFEGQAQLTETFAASLGLTYADAKYPDDCAPQDPADPDFNANAAALCGFELTNAPEFVGILGGAWEQPIANGAATFFVASSARYETERRTSTQGGETADPSILLPGDIQDDNTKINLRVGVEAPDERWAVELWGNNITDERTKNVTFSIPLRGGFDNRARGQFVQEPFTYGVTLRTKF